jgi:hypothetical protein
MLITELLAGLSAKAALGLGIAATSITGAGVAVVLPAAADHATDHPAQVEPAPDTTVPQDVPPTTATTTDDSAPEPTETDEPIGDEPEDAATDEPTTLPPAASFGASVAEDARDGGVDGQEIAARARTKPNHGRETAAQTPAADHGPTPAPESDDEQSGPASRGHATGRP